MRMEGMFCLILLICIALASQAQAAKLPQALPPHMAESGIPIKSELADAEAWIREVSEVAPGKVPQPSWYRQWLSSGLPFSFSYGEQSSSTFLQRCDVATSLRRNGAEMQQQIRWHDERSGLTVLWDVTRYTDYPAVTWRITFANDGRTDTQRIENIRSLDVMLQHQQEHGAFIIHGLHGCSGTPDDLSPFASMLPLPGMVTPLQLGVKEQATTTTEALLRSSTHYLPFFNIETPENRGILIGIGWSGQWQAAMHAAGQCLRVQAGLQESSLELRPGDIARMPRILVVIWEGKRLHGHNMLRQVLYRHFMPGNSGRLHQPILSMPESTRSSEQSIDSSFLLRRCTEIGIEAIAYDSRKALNRTDSAQVYTGLASRNCRYHIPISFAGEMGDARCFGRELLDAADELATLYDESGEVLTGEGGRNEYAEIQRVNSLYQYWDAVQTRYPEVVMTNAAAGRCIDLETVSRFTSHSLPEDLQSPAWDQCLLYRANLYLPGGLLGVTTHDTADYETWSCFAGQLNVNWKISDPSFSVNDARQQTERYTRIRHLLCGDFYPMTPASVEGSWLAYQFHRSDLREGVAFAFKRNDESRKTIRLSLRGIDPQARYHVRIERTRHEATYAGAELINGLVVSISETPGAEMIVYRQLTR